MKAKILSAFLLLILFSSSGCVSILSRGGFRGMYEYPIYPGVINLCTGYGEALITERDQIHPIVLFIGTPLTLLDLPFEIALDSLLIHVDFFRWLLKPGMVSVSEDDVEEEENL